VTNSFFILNNSTRGGGMYNAGSSPLVTNVIFEGNSGYDFGGGMYNNNNSSPALNDIVFSGNTSNSTGGGMLNSTSLPTLTNVIFYNNSANYFGGGVHNTSYSHVAMNNVAFINNSSGRGGGVSNDQSSPTLTNVTFSGNTSQYTGAVLNNSYYSYPKLKNTLIWGNSGAIGVDVSNAPNSSATITYSYTQSALPGTGNIQGTTNLFINDSIPMGADGIWMTADDGLALSCNSPASNVGKNSYVNSGITTDITGAARISGGIVDMGAYENPFNVNITGNTSFCAGNPISDTLIADVGGGVGPYTYSWNTASTNDSILINALGTYFVSVTDTNACVISDTVHLSEYSPNVSIIGDTAFCTGAVIMDTLVVNVNGGNAPYSYLWNTSSTNDSILLNTAGNYSVTVTDASGCSNADTVQITEYLPNVNIIGNAEFCDGTTETLVANVTGEVGPSTFLWNNSATNNNITLNTGGTYSVTVTDVNGCSNADTLQVTLNSLPVVSINGNNTFCFNESEILTANVVGAANPFTFLWNTSSTNNSILVNTGGNYSVTVTDTNGCADTETIQVSTNALPNLSILGDTVFCTGSTDTLVSIASGTLGPYSYLWNTSSTNDTILFNSAGYYNVTVTDFNGCTNIDSIQVTDYLPHVTITGNTSFCDGTTETLVANMSGAIGSYSYLWNTSSIEDSIVIDTGGTYDVMLTDANGCTNNDAFQVIQNPLPNVIVSGNSNPRRNDYDTLSATGADSYLWSTGSTSDTTIVLATSDTSYYVTGTDINGCVNSDTFAIVINTVGVKDYSKDNEILLFPNPASHTVYLKLNGEMYSGVADLKIINQAGKIVMSQKVNINSEIVLPINISGLSKGVYFIEITSNTSYTNLKLVKE